MALKLPNGGANEAAPKKKVTATAAEAATAAVAEAPVNDVPDEVYGSKSDTLVFVAPLGDPSRDDVTPITKKDGTQEKDISPTIFGYAFKSTEDIDIPDFGTPKDLVGNSMDYENLDGSRHVKAGEVFYLTRMETGALMSRDEYSGLATGGEMGVLAVFGVAKKQSKNGAVAAANSDIPTVSLRALKGSIKNIKMIDILSYTSEPGAGGRPIKKRTINPGFEKWSSLAAQRVKPKGTRTGAAKPVSKKNDRALTFKAILEKKRAQAKA